MRWNASCRSELLSCGIGPFSKFHSSTSGSPAAKASFNMIRCILTRIATPRCFWPPKLSLPVAALLPDKFFDNLFEEGDNLWLVCLTRYLIGFPTCQIGKGGEQRRHGFCGILNAIDLVAGTKSLPDSTACVRWVIVLTIHLDIMNGFNDG